MSDLLHSIGEHDLYISDARIEQIGADDGVIDVRLRGERSSYRSRDLADADDPWIRDIRGVLCNVRLVLVDEARAQALDALTRWCAHDAVCDMVGWLRDPPSSLFICAELGEAVGAGTQSPVVGRIGIGG